MSAQFLARPIQALNLYFIVFRPTRNIIAAFADPNDAINYVLAHFEIYGSVPNDDLTITNCSGRPILSVLNTASLETDLMRNSALVTVRSIHKPAHSSNHHQQRETSS